MKRNPPPEIHVLGIGVYCDWEDMAAPARALKRKKVRTYWHCGRRYLDDKEKAFAEVCTPVFTDAGTNTVAVADYFGVTDRIEAQVLTELAWFDRLLAGARAIEEASPDKRDWLDLVHASLAHYFKFQDREPYLETIKRTPTAKSKPSTTSTNATPTAPGNSTARASPPPPKRSARRRTRCDTSCSTSDPAKDAPQSAHASER